MTTDFYQDYYRAASRMIGTPGLYFGKSIKTEMEKPDLLDSLVEAGIVWYDWEGDCETGIGDWYPKAKPRHWRLMGRAICEHEERMRRANCRACKKKWGEGLVRHVCPTCWARPRTEEGNK